MRAKPLRVMWLLNHTSARRFEVRMLKSIGVDEIFLPKKCPASIEFRSASVSFEEDANLSIPQSELAILNDQDWYGSPSREAWDIANKYFDLLFFIFIRRELLASIANNFRGAALWRTYGVAQGVTYASIVRAIAPDFGVEKLKSLGRRLWFAEAYPQLHEVEPEFLSRRRLYLPLGLANVDVRSEWTGTNKKIFFVCPNIETNPYYEAVFRSFAASFSDFAFAIGGAQVIDPANPSVLGFQPQEVHERNMREFRLMFYHSTEPNHIHFHPFEAVRAGMPLVYMAGGMLDRLGGAGLPGRCGSIADARRKVRRILDDDWRLINRIRESQHVLLEPMRCENCQQAWQQSIDLVVRDLATTGGIPTARARKRIAVLVPIGYRGGSLRAAKLLAEAIYEGSRLCADPAEVIFLHLETPGLYSDDEFDDLPAGILRRAFTWKVLTAGEAKRAMIYAGNDGWEPVHENYIVPSDGVADMHDCDAWVVVSDRLSMPLLPLRPNLLMVYDYIQRYIPIMPYGADHAFIAAARRAERVLVTTEFTRSDALQYAGVAPERVVKVPMLAPKFARRSPQPEALDPNYFIWTTNAAGHKNHERAISALRIYFEELAGELECIVTGVDSASLMANPPPHFVNAAALVAASKPLRKRLRWRGELSDSMYRRILGGAAFLWHPTLMDNGTLSVVEAASLGVPSLSSDYPAMREMDAQYSLNLAWMDARRPADMARKLKAMELTWRERKKLLPSHEQLDARGVLACAADYWKAVRACL